MKTEEMQLSPLDKLAIARLQNLKVQISTLPNFAVLWDRKALAFNALSDLLTEANIPVELLRTAIDEAVNYGRLVNPEIYKEGYLDALKDLQQMIASGNLGVSTTALLKCETA